MLVPERLQALVDLLDLLAHALAAGARELGVQLRALLAQPFDLCLNLRNRVHAPENAAAGRVIPSGVAAEQEDNNCGEADDPGDDRDDLEQDLHHSYPSSAMRLSSKPK